MRKIEPTYTEEEFLKLKRTELHQIWFNEALTDGQIAKLYRTDKKTVKARRKELGLGVISCAFLSITGGPAYEDKRKAEKRQAREQKKYEKQLEKERRIRG